MGSKPRNDIIYTLDHLKVGESVQVTEAARAIIGVIVRQMAREAQRLGFKVAQVDVLTFVRLPDDADESECVRTHNMYRVHKPTTVEMASLVRRAGGKCEICAKEKKLVLDHNHVTGKARGLLCMGCNTGMGKLGDTVEGLQRAIDYLRK